MSNMTLKVDFIGRQFILSYRNNITEIYNNSYTETAQTLRYRNRSPTALILCEQEGMNVGQIAATT